MAKLRRIIASGITTLTSQGPKGLLRKAIHSYQFRRAYLVAEQRFGVETTSVIEKEKLVVTGFELGSAREYAPTPPLPFELAIRALPINVKAYTFVDLGCGKGLPLMLAIQAGFRRAVGVEFASNVHQVAQANLETFKRRFGLSNEIETHLGDAAQFLYPPEPLVVYLYNPFGADVLTPVLNNLEKSLNAQPRDCWVIYMVPIHRETFSAFPAMTLHQEGVGEATECLIYHFASVSAELSETATAQVP